MLIHRHHKIIRLFFIHQLKEDIEKAKDPVGMDAVRIRHRGEPVKRSV